MTAGAAIGTVFNGALTKIGELLVEKGMALLELLGPSALTYFDLAVAKIAQVVEAASLLTVPSALSPKGETRR